MVKMEKHLKASKAPYDASLQEVLPGVQERFDALNSCFHVVADECKELKVEVKEIPQKIQQVTEVALHDFMMKIMSSFISSPTRYVANRDVVNTGVMNRDVGIANRNLGVTNRGRAPSSPSAVRTLARSLAGQKKAYLLPAVVRSATQMWLAWYGLSDYRDQPIVGGVDMIEKKHKSTWRMGYSGAQRKTFSRWKKVIALMKDEKESLGSLFLEELDKVFNKTVSGFEKTLVARKKARATDASEEAASEEAASEELAEAA